MEAWVANHHGALRHLHLVLVSLSVGLFSLRALAALAGRRWPQAGWARRGSAAIDSLLLLAGALLWWRWGAAAHAWLLPKLGAVLLYIVLGSLALKRAPTRAGRALALIAAWACVGWIVASARAHAPAWPLG